MYDWLRIEIEEEAGAGGVRSGANRRTYVAGAGRF